MKTLYVLTIVSFLLVSCSDNSKNKLSEDNKTKQELEISLNKKILKLEAKKEELESQKEASIEFIEELCSNFLDDCVDKTVSFNTNIINYRRNYNSFIDSGSTINSNTDIYIVDYEETNRGTIFFKIISNSTNQYIALDDFKNNITQGCIFEFIQNCLEKDNN